MKSNAMRQKNILIKYSQIFLCLFLFASCDSQIDDGPVDITATFRPLIPNSFDADYDEPALGEVALPVEQAVLLSQFPYRSFQVESNYSMRFHPTLPDGLEKSVFLLIINPEYPYGPRVSDTIGLSSMGAGKGASFNASGSEIRIYAFILENESIAYPQSIRAQFRVNDEETFIDLDPARHMISLASQSITRGSEFTDWPNENGFAIRFESTEIDSLIMPGLAVSELVPFSEGGSFKHLNFIGQAHETPNPTNYNNLSAWGARIVDQTEFRLFAFRAE